MTPRRLLYLFLAALTLLRLFYVTRLELSPDETYYYMWSQHLDICYYSKGPGVAWTMWLSTHLFGATPFGIRVFSPLLALGTSLLMASFARRIYGESIAIWTVLALNCIPIFQVGGLIMTIDPLSIFFWMAAMYAFWLALEKGGEWSLWWPATGALIGVGFLCKYTNAMQLLSILLLLIFTPRHRREFARRGFWVMLGVFVVFMLPPIIWNSQRQWITLHHLTMRAGLNKAVTVRPSEFLKFLGLHFAVYSPLIFGAMLYALGPSFHRARLHFKPRFLLWFTMPLYVMYFWLSFNSAGEPNWTAPASLSLGLLAVAVWHEMAQQRRWVRIFGATALGVGIAMCMITLDFDVLREVGIPLSYNFDPSARFRAWQTTADVVEDFRKQYEQQSGQQVFLIADGYQTASELAYYLHDKRVEVAGHPPVYIPESQNIENQFSFWGRYDENTEFAQLGRDYLDAPNTDPHLRDEISRALRDLEAAQKKDPSSTGDAKRALVRALHAAEPNLPIDESFVEEEGPNLFTGRTALYISVRDRGEEKAPSTLQRGFGHPDAAGNPVLPPLVACIDIKRRGLTVRQLRIFVCTDYHEMSL